ncbi:TPA: DUF4433 domain-containing protein, partial [Listeria innocua]|nr:DUF4433 domain-containing protein [Listeria innocua]
MKINRVDEFKQTIEKIRQGEIETTLSSKERLLYPKFMYHYTDINNAVSILKTGKILSRNEAIKTGLMQNDNASQTVISQTENDFKNFVRLYFRPKTPTQFNNEGVRCKKTKSENFDSHCPVPIFFLFKSAELLASNGVMFSNGSLAKHAGIELYNTPEQFESLSFKEIYHNSPLKYDERDHVIKMRHTELVKADFLSLEYLDVIVVRSYAEKDFLQYELGDLIKEKYNDKIKVDIQHKLFLAKWSYINEVRLDDSKIKIIFNIGEYDSEFEIVVVLSDITTKNEFARSNLVSWNMVRDGAEWNLNIASPRSEYEITI